MPLFKSGSGTEEWLNQSGNQWQVSHTSGESFDQLKKAPFDTAGQWTHQYGLPDNSAFGGESLWGSTSTDDFEIQWMGRPGPRFQTDRSGRKPSPLAVNGKMFVQGKERVVAVDAYSGHVYWSKEIPGLSRMNILRDCSNWVADDDHIYIAHKKNMIKINSENGAITSIVPVRNKENKTPNDWGYISLYNDKVIGSEIPEGSNYTNYYGGEGWYDATAGKLAHQVVSRSLFGLDKLSDQLLWEYKNPGSFIINATITIIGNQICWVESRNPEFKLSDQGRAGVDIYKKMYMVSINPDTGEKKLGKTCKNKSGDCILFYGRKQ